MKKIAFAFLLALLPSLVAAEEGAKFHDFSGVIVDQNQTSPSLATCSSSLLDVNGVGFLAVCAAIVPQEKNDKPNIQAIFGLGLAGTKDGDYGLAIFIKERDLVLGVSLPFETFFNSLSSLATRGAK